MHAQKQKKEEKGFDLIEAGFLEKGLIAAGDARSMGLKAIGENYSQQHRQHSEKERKHEKEFKDKTAGNHKQAVKIRMGKLAQLVPRRIKPRYGYMPRQLKRPDSEEPENRKDAKKK